MEENQEILLRMNYDDLIRFLHDFIKSDFMTNNSLNVNDAESPLLKKIEGFKKYIYSIRIPSEMISDIERDFNIFHGHETS